LGQTWPRVSVNDESHAAVLHQLASYRGFVICEKPLATPADDRESIDAALASLNSRASRESQISITQI